ncbi:glycoside hydrolase family 35 protein [Lentinula edodes]|nr:glycoside hydrolase family 35 protein [Lentinula edodes]
MIILVLVHKIVASNYTDQVQFDSYSLLLKDQRVFLHGGEFHTFRLPVPGLWIDILEKVKAAGLNSISVYTHMGLLNPSRGVIDFNDWRDLQPLFDAAREVGVWITLRPGMFISIIEYINAETTAGGIAHWITSEVAGTLRTNASDYREAWTPYIQAIASKIRGNEITDGGPVILLQIGQSTSTTYMAQLEATYREAGIVIPFTYNDAGNQDHFINGTGAVDLHGNDYYPQRYDCADPDEWHTVVDYYDYHMQVDSSQPFYVPEMQGGSLNGWGPGSAQYSGCTLLTGPEFENVFYRQLWASNVKLVSYYMFYGGTSWGALPYGYVYTSYDYGGTISESRALTPKHPEIKLQGIFLRSSPEFYKTNRIGNSSIGLPGGSGVSDPSAVAVTFLQNPDSGAGFWIVRQNDSTSTAITSFTLDVTTVHGDVLHLPLVTSAITLSGRESKVVLTDYAYGAKSRMLYSTAQVFFSGSIDSRDVLFLYGDASQSHEFGLALSGFSSSADVFTATNGTSVGLSEAITVISFSAPFSPGLVTVFESDTQLILFADTPTASMFFAPTISSSTSIDPHKSYWSIGTNETVLIGGPYLVRSASIASDSRILNIRGDLNLTYQSNGTKIIIVGPARITSATWNGKQIDLRAASGTSQRHTPSIVLMGTIPAPNGAQVAVKVPTLSGWKFRNSLPEISKTFDDSSWTVANHTTTNIPFPMYYGDGRILYGCDYGFCENIVLWRGHFNATGLEKSVNLSINGGEAFAASVWLNGVFLNTSYGNASASSNILEETDDQFIFPKGVLLPGEDNVITILQVCPGMSKNYFGNGLPNDNMGLNETVLTLNDPKSPRGIRGFRLDCGIFSEWRVQGKIGGYSGYPDKVRGILNEGGLFGERKGWHLPGFDTTDWIGRPLSSGLPNASAGAGFFVTTFNLSVPIGLDVFMSFTFEEELGQSYRAYLFVNGWMLGKRVANLGPQFEFPVHQGILDYQGVNTVAVAVWSMESNVAISPQLNLTASSILSGGVTHIEMNNPKWSPEGRE